MSSSDGTGRPGGRFLVELLVVVAGVLIALAADRWNQARLDRVTEGAYVARFLEEIEEDSARAADYMQERPAVLAGLDSLVAFVEGAPPLPDLVATMMTVSGELRMPLPVAWTEIQASNSLDVIQDSQEREALTAYYGARERWLLLWARQDSRGRDPLWDELYKTGLFDRNAEWRAPSPLDPSVLRNWPGMRQMLLAVGSGHYFQRNIADQIIDASHAVLEILRSGAD